MRSGIYTGSIAVVLAGVIWSLDGFLRRALYSLPPVVIVFWEHVLGLIVLAVLVAPRLRDFKKITRKQWRAITLVALLSGVLGTLMYTAALGRVQYIQFSVVVLLQQLQPLFAVGTAVLLLREPLTRRFAGLVVLALVAAYFVSFPNLRVNFAQGQGTVAAALLALGSAAAWGSSTAFSKYSLLGVSFLHVTAARFALTPIFALLFVDAFKQSAALGVLSVSQWKYLLVITFSTGMAALALYYFGLQRIPASRSTILELAWPVSAVLTGYFVFQEHLTATQLLGAAVLIIVMIQIARDARRLAIF